MIKILSFFLSLQTEQLNISILFYLQTIRIPVPKLAVILTRVASTFETTTGYFHPRPSHATLPSSSPADVALHEFIYYLGR